MGIVTPFIPWIDLPRIPCINHFIAYFIAVQKIDVFKKMKYLKNGRYFFIFSVNLIFVMLIMCGFFHDVNQSTIYLKNLILEFGCNYYYRNL